MKKNSSRLTGLFTLSIVSLSIYIGYGLCIYFGWCENPFESSKNNLGITYRDVFLILLAIITLLWTRKRHIQTDRQYKQTEESIFLNKVNATYLKLVETLSGEESRGSTANTNLINAIQASIDNHYTDEKQKREARRKLLNFAGMNLNGAVLERANLTGADLSGADLRGANLFKAKLNRSDLEGANLYDADLRSAHLNDSNLRNAELIKADLTDAKLNDANLYDAILVDAKLIATKLIGADLIRAKLIRADLDGADLDGADLRSAKLFKAEHLDRTNNLYNYNPLNINALLAKNLDQAIDVPPYILAEWKKHNPS